MVREVKTICFPCICQAEEVVFGHELLKHKLLIDVVALRGIGNAHNWEGFICGTGVFRASLQHFQRQLEFSVVETEAAGFQRDLECPNTLIMIPGSTCRSVVGSVDEEKAKDTQ